MVPFTNTKVMQHCSANAGATQAATDRIAVLVKLSPSDLLPAQWNWNDGRAPHDFSAKTLMTIYAASGHSGWSVTYNSQDMWQWLYAQKREAAPTLKINSPLITPISAGLIPVQQLWLVQKLR